MFRSVIGSPSAMPRDVPIGCPYCSTNVPSGMALVANRWPGVTAPVSVTVRPPGASRLRPAVNRRLHDGDVVGRIDDDREIAERG
jgi:hypothetical protein